MSTDTAPPSSTEVATTGPSGLAPLYQRPAGQNLEERSTPIIYLMADLSRMVQSGLAKRGQIVAALSAEDEDPLLLADAGGDSFKAFILTQERYVTRGDGTDGWERLPGDYQRDFNNPDDNDVNVGYRYLIAIPGNKYPVASLLLIRTAGRDAFKKINFELDNAMNTGSTEPVFVEFSSKEATSNQNGKKYFKWVARSATPTDDDLEFVKPFVEQAIAIRDAQSQQERPAITSGASF